jgi:hypothetical protein
MMTVARRNRVWTLGLCNKLVREINEEVARTGITRVKAFDALSGSWGASPATLSGVYYKTARKDKGIVVTDVLKKSAPSQMDINAAIAIIKGMGGSVTISF